MRRFVFWIVLLTAWPSPAAERRIDLGSLPLDQPPPGFRSLVAGRGQPGDWKVILDDVPTALEPLTSKAPAFGKRAVLAQLSREAMGNRAALLILEDETYGDFRLSVRFKIVGGAFEQAAGVVFHYQNESNYYVASASALSDRFRCHKIVNGALKPPIGPEVRLVEGVWHELAVQCEGTRILCSLDRTNEIKLIDSVENHPGRIGFWTQADTVAHFTDTAIIYTPRENPAEKLVQAALKEYPRVLDLKIHAITGEGKGPTVVASKDSREVGQPGGELETEVISRGTYQIVKGKGTAKVILPLRDRNGDPIAAVTVVLKSFPGQTDDNALVRARPIVRLMQSQVRSREELLR